MSELSVFTVSEWEQQVFIVWSEQDNENQVNEMTAYESGQWVLGIVVVSETWLSGVECPLVALRGTPAGDRYSWCCLVNLCKNAGKEKVKNLLIDISFAIFKFKTTTARILLLLTNYIK